MPALDFTLPHWAYLLGLILFPAAAMVLARRPRPRARRHSLFLGYLILVLGGIMGLHRLYLKNLWGLAYAPFFIFILYANGMATDARSDYSDAADLVRQAERVIAQEEPRVAQAREELDRLRAAVAETEEDSFARKRAEKNLQRALDRIERGEARLEQARADLVTARPREAEAAERRAFWNAAAGWALRAILLFMLIDAVLMPWMVRRADAAIVPDAPLSEAERKLAEIEEAERRRDEDHVSDGWTGWIDRLSLYSGEFVAYWAVIAVVVYYYEVISRYVFNSPTSWAHESMYLMFGMQYLISGAYAMLTDSHVRVDVFYARLPPRGKALVDLLTSVFFFIFAGTLLVTSWIFAMDSIAVSTGNGLVSQWARGELGLGEMLARFDLGQLTDPAIRWGEISFNEWEIPLWPMKWMMVAGGALLLLQGVSKFAQDLRVLVRGG
ncbi:TRAP transporter small permease subunit [Oceanicella actignis]|uniref:TRAP transporter small permease subunit n=1 Tax=Oceanicella actignis TaxID=1189325 RepID=UPI0011E7CB40|nr:TRAP transporter small permease subunit [Oceanicella actignis]TYO89555.1 TRAP-type mannitol/chloroaromatic compound transport system permease small subunit [Oceanicella actignis]